MQKITPFLWFDGKAEEAMNFYVSIFRNSKTGRITRYGEAGPGPKGTVMSVIFQLEGQEFFALNGGPHFTFSPASGRRKAGLRVAKGQVRGVVADHSARSGRDAA